MVVYFELVVVVQLNLNFPSLCPTRHCSDTRDCQTSRVYPNSPQEYVKSGSWGLLPPPPLCICRRWKAHFSSQGCSTAWGEPSSFRPFVESQHRPKSWKSSQVPQKQEQRASAVEPPSGRWRRFLFFLACFQPLQACWYIPERKTQPRGWKEEQHAHAPGVAHVVQRTGEGSSGEGDSSGRRRRRRKSPVRGSGFSSSEVTATVDVIEADGYIILFYSDFHLGAAPALEAERSRWFPEAAEPNLLPCLHYSSPYTSSARIIRVYNFHFFLYISSALVPQFNNSSEIIWAGEIVNSLTVGRSQSFLFHIILTNMNSYFLGIWPVSS